MKLNLTLHQKGLALVLGFVLVEIFTGAALTFLLKQTEADAKTYSRAMTATGQASDLLGSLYNGAYLLTMYSLTHNAALSQQYDAIPERIHAESQLLLANVDDESHRRRIEKLAQLTDKGFTEMTAFKKTLEEGNISTMMPLVRRIKPLIVEFTTELQRFIAEERMYASRLDLDASGRIRDLLQIFVYTWLAVTVFVSIALMRFVTTQITKRIDIIQDNAFRLASGERLQKRLPGSDELARLDMIFHEMASALQDALSKEQQTAHAFEASEKRVRTIIENMPVGLMTLKDDGTITDINPRTEQLLSCRPQDMIGQNVATAFEFKAKKDGGSFMDELTRKALNRVSEMQARRADGATFPTELSLNKLETDEGNVLLLNMLDVTERHEVERLKREFVAMVSHDLKTPLTSVRGSISLVTGGMAGEINEKAMEILETAETEIERLTKLISDLLDVEKIEAGQLRVDAEEISLEPAIKRAIASVSGFAATQGVKVEAASTDARVHGDTERLIQVLVNLLSNAIKFSSAASTVQVTVEKPDANWVEVSVVDRGRGIPEEHLQAIFEKFHQVESADAKSKGGTGLGLPICKTIIEQHGGTIGVRSKVGEGSTFWFKLKAAP